MHFIRQTASIIAIVFLPIFLFLFGLLFSLFQVFGSADSIKSALDESKTYDTFVRNSLNSLDRPDQEGEEGEEQKREGLPLDDPEIQRIIGEAAPPEYLKQQTTDFLDAMYNWTRGDVEVIEFTVDFRESKTQLANGLAGYANERLNTLPTCSEPVNTEFEAFDVFNINCVPPGLDKAAAANQVRQEITKGEFLEDPVLTEEDLVSGKDSTPEEQLQGLRNAYNGLKASVIITGMLSLLLLAGAILLAPQWRTGLRRASIVAIVVGAVSALIAWTSAFLAQSLSSGFAESEIQATLTDLLSVLTAYVRNWWLGYGIILIVLGIAALVILRFVKPDPSFETPTGPSKTKKSRTANQSARKTTRR